MATLHKGDNDDDDDDNNSTSLAYDLCGSITFVQHISTTTHRMNNLFSCLSVNH